MNQLLVDQAQLWNRYANCTFTLQISVDIAFLGFLRRDVGTLTKQVWTPKSERLEANAHRS